MRHPFHYRFVFGLLFCLPLSGVCVCVCVYDHHEVMRSFPKTYCVLHRRGDRREQNYHWGFLSPLFSFFSVFPQICFVVVFASYESDFAFDDGRGWACAPHINAGPLKEKEGRALCTVTALHPLIDLLWGTLLILFAPTFFSIDYFYS